MAEFVLTAPSDPDRHDERAYYVRLWDTETGELIGQTAAHDKGVYMVAVSDDDRFILTGTGDYNFRGRHIQSVFLWDSRTLRLVDQCGGRALTNADAVGQMEIEDMLSANGVRNAPRMAARWSADRIGESATAVVEAKGSREEPTLEAPITWLPLVPTNAETPYAWHPSEPILAVATGPFLQLFRLEIQ